MKTHQFTVHNYPGSPFQFILRYEAVRMTLMESITLLEGTTKGSVIDNMGRFRAHKNVVGAMYIEKTYVPFPAWPIGLWNTVCVMASSQEKYYEVRVNEETVFMTRDYQGQHRQDTALVMSYTELTLFRLTNKENLLLMGRFKKGKYEHSMFGALTDINIWDSLLTSEALEQWSNFDSTEKGDFGHFIREVFFISNRKRV